ncbi:hypothetical protein [Clostridium sp. HBUAS56010]|uniref:hypothetical protein n=1 Tax=Clostridium sp. HBUAS56010 TaxID=2571127 RepID=UPI0011777461|nr:hypothetical protein [Clostridium sp. HBUAS56010]
MDRTNRDSDISMLEEETIYDYVTDTIKAFVDTLIPRSPDLAEMYGAVQYYGAMDFDTDEYLVMSLDRLYTPMTVVAAELLNAAAKQFLYESDDERNEDASSDGKYFLRLTPFERFAAMQILTGSEAVNYYPVLDDVGVDEIIPVFPLMNRLSYMGYYSEWWGYGTTRTLQPNQRVLEFFPGSWEQIGYPGPSRGYRVAQSYDYTRQP